MSWGAALGGIVGGIGGIAGLFDDSGKDAAEAMEAAQLRMEARLDKAASDVEGSVDNYYQTLDRIEREFDPYDMTQAFESFYEGVLRPMDLEFEEYMLPSIKSAYSTGLVGDGAGQSGAAKEAELKAKQRLSTSKGQLLAGERSQTVDRNIQLADREKGDAAERLSAGTLAPNMRAGAAGSIFGAEQAAIETRYAADRSKFESLLSIPSTIISGVEAGGLVQGGIDRIRKSKEKK